MLASNSNVLPDGWSKVDYRNSTADLGFNLTLSSLLFRPTDSTRLPLVIWLHGYGQRISTTPVPGILELVPQRTLPSFVLIPQAPQAHWAPVSGLGSHTGSHPLRAGNVPAFSLLMSLIGSLLATERKIDASMLVLGGASMGGYGTWELLHRFPQTFRVALPICGGGDPRRARQLQGVCIWAFHHILDALVPVNASREMVASLAAARNLRLARAESGGRRDESSADGSLRYTEFVELDAAAQRSKRAGTLAHMRTAESALGDGRVWLWVRQRLRLHLGLQLLDPR
jgi:predicted peptidase